MNLDWQDRAACRGEDPEVFFTSTSGPAAHREESRALAVCAKCPVVLQCRAYTDNDQYGVSGGKVRTRKSGSYRSHLSEPLHGTEGRYKKHRRDGEEACRACKSASTLASAERRQARERVA